MLESTRAGESRHVANDQRWHRYGSSVGRAQTWHSERQVVLILQHIYCWPGESIVKNNDLAFNIFCRDPERYHFAVSLFVPLEECSS